MNSSIDEEVKRNLISKIPNIKLKEKLGKGGYGDVYNIESKDYNLVIKVQFAENNDVKKNDMFKNECIFSKSLKHKNIINTLLIRKDLVNDNNMTMYSIFMEKALYQNLYFFLEYFMKNNLMKITLDKRYFTYLLKPNSLFTSYFAGQIINGLQLLYESNIIHRDLKLENILCCTNFILKFCDFGLSKLIKPKNKDIQIVKSTWTYQCPEVYKKNHKINVKYAYNQDYFSLGIILYYLIFGENLFPKGNKYKMDYNTCINDIRNGKEKINKMIKNKFIDCEIGNITNKLLFEEISDCPQIIEIADNKWIHDNQKEANKIKSIFPGVEIKFFVEMYKFKKVTKKRNKFRI